MLFEVTITDISYQTVGIIALIISVLSFQSKDLKKILIMQSISAIFWVTHCIIGHAYAGCIMNVISGIRCILFALLKNKKGRFYTTIILSLAFIAAAFVSVFVFNEYWFIALVTSTASVVGNIFFYIGDDKKYRIAQLCFISPCWLFHNIWYMSIGGICCEILNMVSTVIALIRFRKKEN